MNIIHNKERERERKRVIIASDNNIKIYHNNNNNNNKCQRKTCIKTKWNAYSMYLHRWTIVRWHQIQLWVHDRWMLVVELNRVLLVVWVRLVNVYDVVELNYVSYWIDSNFDDEETIVSMNIDVDYSLIMIRHSSNVEDLK